MSTLAAASLRMAAAVWTQPRVAGRGPRSTMKKVRCTRPSRSWVCQSRLSLSRFSWFAACETDEALFFTPLILDEKNPTAEGLGSFCRTQSVAGTPNANKWRECRALIKCEALALALSQERSLLRWHYRTSQATWLPILRAAPQPKRRLPQQPAGSALR